MAAYGMAASRAVELFTLKTSATPEDAWNHAVAETFPHSPSCREKSCPRGTFLGLCSCGLIKGIPAGNYTISEKNKNYGLRALELLRQDPSLANDEKYLWERVIAGEKKAYNSQMDVVISLWSDGLLS